MYLYFFDWLFIAKADLVSNATPWASKLLALWKIMDMISAKITLWLYQNKLNRDILRINLNQFLNVKKYISLDFYRYNHNK